MDCQSGVISFNGVKGTCIVVKRVELNGKAEFKL